MKKALYPGIAICVVAAAFVAGLLAGRKQQPIPPKAPDGLVLSAGGNSPFPVEYRGAAAFLLEGKIPEAEAVYNQLVQQDTNSAEPYIGLAICRYRRGDLVGARDLYEKGLARDPKSLNALIGLGSTLGGQSDHTNAAAVYEKALSVKEDSPEAHWGLALAAFYLGQSNRARAHLDRFERLQPDSPRIAGLEGLIGKGSQPAAATDRNPPYP